MDDLAKLAYSKLARFQIMLAVPIFAPAWSLAYWQGWLVWSAVRRLLRRVHALFSDA